jgi:predicted enzyme related to lactoylglutathione lyase
VWIISQTMAAAAVLYVKDLGLMRTFYERCFAMSAAESHGDNFCVLGSQDWELSLVSAQTTIGGEMVAGGPEVRRASVPVKLAFEVANIDDLRSVVSEAGGYIDPNEATWEFRGRRHLDCLDPEGNVVQLRARMPGE